MMELDRLSQYSGARHFKPISVYDYPEHLNPFYEDDNHKRLRFWTISRKSKDGKSKSGSSLSINSLRDMWAFKTFRLSRKRSSTLGINKTSESPPPLRKEFYDNNYNTYDSTCRQTINGGSTNEVFQRNTPYRASTGGMRSNKNYDTQSEILFNRNDTYRSTVQHAPAGQRYNPSSVTPVLSQKFSKNSPGHGASQTSLGSTNPFEDDDDDVDQTPNGHDLTGGQVRKSYRKKRRAPPPPTTGRMVSRLQEEPCAPDHIELKIVEDSTPVTTTELPSISSLTAEIETLVKSVEEDPVSMEKSTSKVQKGDDPNKTLEMVEISRKEDSSSKTERCSSEITEKVRGIETVTIIPTTVADINRGTDTHTISHTEVKTTSNESEGLRDQHHHKVTFAVEEKKEPVVVLPPIERVVINEVTVATVPKSLAPEIVQVTTISEAHSPSIEMMLHEERVVQSSGYDSDNDSETMSLNTSTASKSSTGASHDLKIIEDEDADRSSNESPSRVKVNSYEIKYRPLNDTVKSKSERAFEQRQREKQRDAWRAELCRSNSSGDEVTVRTSESEQPYHSERRRSVREIIESINRNQSLLQATNYGPLNGKYDYSEHPNLKALKEAEAQQAASLNPERQLEVEVINNERCYSYYDNVPAMLQNLEEQSTVFEKCSSPPKRRPSYEWNPVPKPARMSQNLDASDASAASGNNGNWL